MAVIHLAVAMPELASAGSSPEERALHFLAREVPRWTKENGCYSCHNNGDAARTLYLATKLRYRVPETALPDTTAWLRQPHRWDSNGGQGEFSDKRLARIQFASALRTAVEVGAVTDRQPLIQAAQVLVEDQSKEGCWTVGVEGTVGSPATYGRFLATYLVRETLQAADSNRFADQIARADRWLRTEQTKNVLDSAAVVLALHGAQDEVAGQQRARCLELIRRGESNGGGWGPEVFAPPEPFDTAVVLLALWPMRERPGIQPLIDRGREYLLAKQLDDGSWPETTRPPGATSYAQWISTTGWATLALLKTRPRHAR